MGLEARQEYLLPGVFQSDINMCFKGSKAVTFYIPVDLCDPNPCQNGGQCKVEGGTVMCSCVSGYTGKLCDGRI